MSFTIGMIKDLLGDDMPLGSWRSAKNVTCVVQRNGLVSELGTEAVASGQVASDLVPVGAIRLDADRVILMLKSNVRATDPGVPGSLDEIGVLDIGKDTYTTKIRGSLLNFSFSSHITGTAEYNYKKEIIVAYRDSVNPPRVINLDNPAFAVDNDGLITDVAGFTLANAWPEILPINYNLREVENAGGVLVSGAYQIGVGYITPGESDTNVIGFSQNIFISDDRIGEAYDSYNGCEPGTPTNKAITITISGLSTYFTKFYLIVISNIGGVLGASKIGPYRIRSSQMTMTYTGSETSESYSLDRALIDYQAYSRAKAVASVKSRLHWFNMNALPEVKYQKYACNIQSKWVHEDAVSLPHLGSGGNVSRSTYGDPVFIFHRKGFMPGQPYAFYIRFRYKVSGLPTPWFHIPGRSGSNILSTNSQREIATGFGDGPYAEDALISDIVANEVASGDPAWATVLAGDLAVDPDVRWYQTRETAAGPNYMGFWANRDEFYPQDDEYDGSKDYDGIAIGSGRDLRGQRVLHHKFPELRTLVDLSNPFVDTVAAVSTFSGSAGMVNAAFSMFNVSGDIYRFTFQSSSTTVDGSVIDDGTPGTHGQVEDEDPGNIEDNKFIFIQDGLMDVTTSGLRMTVAATQNLPTDNLQYRFQMRLVHYSAAGTVLATYGAYDEVKSATGTSVSLNSSTFAFSAVISGQAGDYLQLEGYADPYYSTGAFTVGSAICFGSMTLALAKQDRMSLEGNRAVRALGIKFENIFIPEEIKAITSGFEIGYAERTLDNMTIVGQSALNHFNWEDSSFSNDVPVGDPIRLHPFELLRSGALPRITHLTNQLIFSGITYPAAPNYPYKERDYVNGGLATFTEGHTNHPSEYILPLDNVRMIPANTEPVIETVTVDNFESETCVYAITRAVAIVLTTPAQQRYLSNLCVFRRNVFSQFQDQPTVILASNVFGYDGSADETAETTTVYGGDIFVVPHGIRKTKPNDGWTDVFAGNDLGLDVMDIYPVYCVDNIILRHTGTGVFERHYPEYGGTSGSGGDWGFLLSEAWTGSPSSAAAAWADFIQRQPWYGYNTDYSRLHELSKSFPYDPTDIYSERRPFLIIRSVLVSRETNFVGWWEYPPLDYFEMVRDRGEGVQLIANDEQLLIFMEYAAFSTQPTTRIETSEGAPAVLGTGDLFDFEPSELVPDDGGYVGTKSQYGIRKTILGVVVVDSEMGKVFIIGRGVDEISGRGMRRWFFENFRLIAASEMAAVDPSISFEGNEVSPWGLGWMASYDQEEHRIIIAKKDLSMPSGQFKGTHNPSSPGTSGFYYYQGEIGRVISSLIPITNENVLDTWSIASTYYALTPVSRFDSQVTDRSITISYSPAINDGKGGWISRHDWRPDLMVGTKNFLFSTLGVGRWKHNKGLPGSFYGTLYECYVEPIFSLGEVALVFSVLWRSYIGNPPKANRPITGIIVYGERQCSGLVAVEKSMFTQKGAHPGDAMWRFDKFLDVAVHDSDGEVVDFFDSYTDAFVSVSADNTKPWHERIPFRSNWIGVRFVYDNADGLRLSLITSSVGAHKASR